MTMDNNTYDLIIIGGGPSGINVAIDAQAAGLNTIILEKGVLVNSIYHFPTNMTFFSTSLNLEIAQTPFISHSDKPTRREALEYYRRLQESFGLQVRNYEPVLSMTQMRDGNYRVETSKDHYQAQAVVIATGFYDTPRQLNVPGEDLPKVKHYYDDAHPYIGQKLLVVGAANSACDVALETWQKGAAEVTMAIREEEIYPKVKYWIRPNIENRIKEGSIKAHFKTTVQAIHQDRVDLLGPDGPFSIENDFVLAMTGYQPDYPLLEKLGVTFTPDEEALPIYDPDTLETEQARVYLAGVVCAGRQTSTLFIENTRHHGQLIVDHLKTALAQRRTVTMGE
jgi:thioredoxin reductase (NADPH)